MTESEHLARMERALAYGGPTHTVADVVRLVREGEAQFWQRGDGCIVTELHTSPLRRACHYWLVSGVLDDCLALQPEIDAWGQGRGLHGGHGDGPQGMGPGAWERVGSWVAHL